MARQAVKPSHLPELGTAEIIKANARDLPLEDNSIDLVVTSPPYFAQRSYQDGGEHYEGQLGDERTPDEFVDSLLDVTRELMRVTKPTGSIWVNLGDKYAGSSRHMGAHGGTLAGSRTYDRALADVRNSETPEMDAGDVRNKSLIGVPWRYALRCVDELGLILREEVIWSKLNGLPESVTDRCRRSHEQWFHFTLEPHYFAAIDEIRERHSANSHPRRADGAPSPKQAAALGQKVRGGGGYMSETFVNPLGRLPDSVWPIATEPLDVPPEVAHARCCKGKPRKGCEDGLSHFAAFPSEWPRRIILGWSPREICTKCGEGRRPVTECTGDEGRRPGGGRTYKTMRAPGEKDTNLAEAALRPRVIVGHVCACDEPTAPTTPGKVLDPFGGTGTTAMVAKALGRHGVNVDMSADYCALAEWRTNDRDQIAKVLDLDKNARARLTGVTARQPKHDPEQPGFADALAQPEGINR